MKWYLIVVLTCILLKTVDVERLFMWSLVICISSLEKCLFRCFTPFSIVLFIFFLLSCKCALYILDTRPLLDMWFAHVLSILCVFYFMNFCPYFFLYIFFGFILLFLKKNTTSWDWFLVYFFIFCDICIYKAFDYLPKHCFNFSWICIFIFKCLLWFLLWHELL